MFPLDKIFIVIPHKPGKLNIKDFISDYFDFKDSVEAYQKLLDKKILKKGIIKF